jgi:ankyrin repeat protein
LRIKPCAIIGVIRAINFSNIKQMTSKTLLKLSNFGRLDEVRAALQQNLDPNYSDSEDGYTLLHWAAQEGYVETSSDLLFSLAQM